MMFLQPPWIDDRGEMFRNVGATALDNEDEEEQEAYHPEARVHVKIIYNRGNEIQHL